MFSALSKKYEKLEQSVIEQMMDAADTDNDGEISIDEFKAIMRASPSAQAEPAPAEPATPSRQAAVETPSDTAVAPVSYTHLRAHETEAEVVCGLLLEI